MPTVPRFASFGESGRRCQMTSSFQRYIFGSDECGALLPVSMREAPRSHRFPETKARPSLNRVNVIMQ